MEYLAEHKIRVRYVGGLAERNLLPAYDGAKSIDGISRALIIATHAYMTGEVVSRATALRGAKIVLLPPKPGSFVLDALVLLESHPATTSAAAALMAMPFYDFLKTALRRAIGILEAEPETRHIKALYERKQPPPLKHAPADLDELAEMLEGSLQDAHRPIGSDDGVEKIEISSRRGNLVSLDVESKDWVNTRQEIDKAELFHGNVTRFNSISRNGRAYIDELGRVVPVRPDTEFAFGALPFLTWSLHGSNIGTRNKLELRARRVCSATGKVKRLLLVDCKRVDA